MIKNNVLSQVKYKEEHLVKRQLVMIWVMKIK